MPQLLPTLDWKLIISLVTLALVIFGILWGNNLLGRREKVKIKTGGLNFNIRNGDRIIFKLFSAELQRSGNKEFRSIKQILLRLDNHSYVELSRYFDFGGATELILAGRQENLPKDTTKAFENWSCYEYKMLDSSAWNNAKEKIIERLNLATFEVGLIWEDKPNKTQWVRITPEAYDKWRKV